MDTNVKSNFGSLSLFCLLGSLVVVESTPCAGQNGEPETATEELIARWQRYYRDVAKGYKFQIGEDSLRDLDWVEKPVLTYTNPVRGRQQHGAIFIWTSKGRPAAMASIWSITKLKSPEIRLTAHELVSLTSLQLIAKRPSPETLRPGVAPEWSIQNSDFTWNRLEVAADRAGALSVSRASLQMRRLARRFRAELVTRSDRSVNQLRMLETPIFQYESQSKRIIGGLFAFALATDPELFLWLEYQRPQDAQAKGTWRYRPIRMSLLELKLYLDDAMVWTELDQKEKQNPAYHPVFRVREFPADQPPTSE